MELNAVSVATLRSFPLNFFSGPTNKLNLTFFVPPLIIAVALYVRMAELRCDLPGKLTLAAVGVLLAVAVTARGMHFLAAWEGESAILFRAQEAHRRRHVLDLCPRFDDEAPLAPDQRSRRAGTQGGAA